MSNIISLLRPYQEEDIQEMIKRKKVINANDMGLGKTIEAIEAANRIKAQRILVVCPKALMWSWQEAIGWNANKSVTAVISGTTAKKKYWAESEANWYITTYASLRLESVGNKKKFKYDRFEKEWDLVIFDESQNLSNRKALHVAGVKKLKTSYLFQLTGTPIMIQPGQLWQQLNLLDKETFSGYWKFVEKYLSTTTNIFCPSMPLISGVANESVFKDMLAPYMIRRTKKEVLTELPEKIYSEVIVKMDTKQRKQYDQMEKEMLVVMAHDEVFMASTALEQQMRLRQICLDPSLILGSEGAPSAKTEALLEYVDSIDISDQIVIFTEFRSYAYKLQELLSKKYKTCVFTGETKDQERKSMLHGFEKGDIRIFIGTIRAGGVGLNLQTSSILIFMDKSWNPKLNEQVEDRINRMGQKGIPQIVSFITKDSVEEDLEKVLKKRNRIINRIIVSTELYQLQKSRRSTK